MTPVPRHAALVRARLGRVELVPHPRDPLAQADVWCCVADGRPVAWLKAHRSAAAAARERAGQAWAAAVGWGTPAVLAAPSDAPEVLLLAHAEGVPLDAVRDRSVRLGALERLGRWLRDLHGLPHVDDDPVPLADALALRAAAWRERARGQAEIDDLARVLTGPWPDPGPRVPCHRDLRPRNVLVDPDGGISVIDLGQARPDAAVVDLVQLGPEVPWVGADGWEALIVGLGARPDPALWRRARALDALASLGWSARPRRSGSRDGGLRGMLRRGGERA